SRSPRGPTRSGGGSTSSSTSRSSSSSGGAGTNSGAGLPRRHHRKLDEARRIHALDRFAVVGGFGPEDVRNERLGIPVVEREPARLHLHHDPVARQEDMVRGRKRELVEKRLARRDRLRRFQALAIPAPEECCRDPPLV